MSVKQISVFLENKKGRLIAVTECLAQNDINIHALSVADTADFGILRIIVDHPNRAYRVLKENKFTVLETDVLAVQVPNQPGGLNTVLSVLEEAGINLDYIYAFFGEDHRTALDIIKVDNMEAAVEVLRKAGLKLLDGEEVYNI